FPDPFGADRKAFLEWARILARVQYAMPEAFGPAAAADAPDSPVPPGFNVVGYALSVKGVGEALRATVRALTAARLRYGVIDFPDDSPESAADRHLIGLLRDFPYRVNLIHVNADQFPRLADRFGTGFLQGRYNIGFWMWELPEFPASYHRAFQYLDEVGVASGFGQAAIARVSPIPVVKVPLALPVDGLPTLELGRDHFGLPEHATVFLFMFDVLSVTERKNPFGLIAAFQRAFKPSDSVRLVLKTLH